MSPKSEIEIRSYEPSNQKLWDEYVKNHPDATHCHLSGWKEVIEKSYGHKTYYLIAFCPETNPKPFRPSVQVPGLSANIGEPAEHGHRICGILPLVHFRSLFFGRSLVSMPFLNYGGILADDEEAGEMLLHKTKEIRNRIKAEEIELRHIRPIPWLKKNGAENYYLISNTSRGGFEENHDAFSLRTHKVRMLLRLPESGESLFKAFNSKLRSQIQRPKKEGMEAKIGGIEYLDSFYDVFAANMRDLGSPVHARKFFQEIFKTFRNMVKIGIVKYHNQVVAAGIIFGFKGVVEIPWASSLKKYNKLSPNMLLYWSLLEHSANGDFSWFDFGRSTQGERTFNFKKQWGAEPILLHWYRFGRPSGDRTVLSVGEKKLSALWERLPISLANFLGPRIRARISL